jgi:diadenosine tetraphosphatase ApaH/serine/threonine PP2A family protein phosphatase
MRYAILSDIHANLEALEAVLARLDEIAKDEPIDQIWFLGDLVGYGPDPNECIRVLRERTDVMIAGNHDWAAVGKIDLDDFSAAARISAEWTAERLTPEHRDFLINLPERVEIGECTLVHGSPYGPLWEYLTSQALAERSFQYFDTRYCLVGHTHVPLIFIQPDPANIPTLPLAESAQSTQTTNPANGAKLQENVENAGNLVENHHEQTGPADHNASGGGTASTPASDGSDTGGDADDEDDETVELVMVPGQQSALTSDASTESSAHAHLEPHNGTPTPAIEDAASTATGDTSDVEDDDDDSTQFAIPTSPAESSKAREAAGEGQAAREDESHDAAGGNNEADGAEEDGEVSDDDKSDNDKDDGESEAGEADKTEERTPESEIASAEERLTSEIEELLSLLGLSQSMVEVTNEMLTPPEGHWEAPPGYRAIINPGGVGQPRDGDPRAAFMIYDTERGFEFYRVPYDFEKTQEKIISAGLPQFLAVRLAYGR